MSSFLGGLQCAGNISDENMNIHVDGRVNYHKQRCDEEIGNCFANNDKNPNSEELDDTRNCKICMDAAVEVTFVPCGHLVVCQSCSHGLSMCPICRKDVTESLRTYFYGN